MTDEIECVGFNLDYNRQYKCAPDKTVEQTVQRLENYRNVYYEPVSKLDTVCVFHLYNIKY